MNAEDNKTPYIIELTDEEAEEAIAELEDQGFTVLKPTRSQEQPQDLTDVYELLEDMTPREVRLARQLLGQMHQLWEGIVNHEERLLRIEDQMLVLAAKSERIRIIEGALEETINRVEELRGKAPKKHVVQPALRMRGVYCRNCAKPLEGRQKVFCTRKCAAVWHGQHQGEIATPRLEINEKPEAVVEAGVGVVKGSVSDNGKALVKEAAVA